MAIWQYTFELVPAVDSTESGDSDELDHYVPEQSINADGENSLTFTITPENSNFNTDHDCEFYATSVLVYLTSIISKSNQIRIRLVNNGNPTFINLRNERVSFNHKPIAASMTWDTQYIKFVNEKTDNNLIGQSKQFLGVSPFATWSLSVTNKGELNLTDLKEISISFNYSYFPKTS